MSQRFDLFTPMHKGLRAMLFDLATDAARIDMASEIAVDLLVERVLRVLAFLDEHARHEEVHLMPAVRAAAPELSRRLADDRIVIAAAHSEVELCADDLELAAPDQRREVCAQLVRLLNLLIVQYLAHMGRKEVEANAALWATHTDEQLAALQRRQVSSIPPERYTQWMLVIVPAVDPVDRRSLAQMHSPVG